MVRATDPTTVPLAIGPTDVLIEVRLRSPQKRPVANGGGSVTDERWRFLQFEDDDDPPARRPRAGTEEAGGGAFTGTDAEDVVTVVVDASGTVQRVRLAPQWRNEVDPTALQRNVLAAVNAATLAALSGTLDDLQNPSPPDVAVPEAPVERLPAPCDPLLEVRKMIELMDTVNVDLGGFEQRLGAIPTDGASVESSGRHVVVTGRNGRIVDVSVDPRWAAAARSSEIETELTGVFQAMQDQTSPGELVSGPHSAAISELNRLVAQPDLLLRRLGLTGPHGTNPQIEGTE